MSSPISPHFETSKRLAAGEKLELWQLDRSELLSLSHFYYNRQKEAFRRILSPEDFANRLQQHEQEGILEKMHQSLLKLPAETLILGHKEKGNDALLSSFILYPVPKGKPFKLNEALWEDMPMLHDLRASDHVWYGSRLSVDVPSLLKKEFPLKTVRSLSKSLLFWAFRYGLSQNMEFFSAEGNVFSVKLLKEKFGLPIQQLSDPFSIRWMKEEAMGIALTAEEMRVWLDKQADCFAAGSSWL